MVARVDQHFGPLARLAAQGVAHAPIGQVGVIERGLERFVLDKQRPLGPAGVHRLAHRPQRLGQVVLAAADIILAGIVRAVGQPQTQMTRADRPAKLDRIEHVPHGGAAHFRIGIAKRAELVNLILEQIRIDRSDAHAVPLGQARDGRRLVVGRKIP